MFKKSLIIAAAAALLMPAAHAQQDQAKALAQGFGYAFVIQGKCTHPARTAEQESTIITQITNAIERTTKADIETIITNLAAGSRQAKLVKKPTPKQCTDADDMLAQAKTM